jgi:hypothetical protein
VITRKRKFSNPTNLLPKIPRLYLKSVKAMYAPGIGIYEKIRKNRIAGVHMRMRVLHSQSRFPRDTCLAFITVNPLIQTPLSFETDFSISKNSKPAKLYRKGNTRRNVAKPVSVDKKSIGGQFTGCQALF